MDSYPEIKLKHIVSMCSKINLADNLKKIFPSALSSFSQCLSATSWIQRCGPPHVKLLPCQSYFSQTASSHLDKILTSQSFHLTIVKSLKLTNIWTTTSDNTLVTTISGMVIQQIHHSELLKHILYWRLWFYLSYWKRFVGN